LHPDEGGTSFSPKCHLRDPLPYHRAYASLTLYI
jgi:hypothetical protein